MPLVFVHGVANRLNTRYELGGALRDLLFRRFLLTRICKDPDAVAILNPFWGDHAAKLRWSHASLPVEDGEALGGADSVDGLVSAALAQARLHGEADSSVLLSTARRSLPDSIDLLFAALAEFGTFGATGVEDRDLDEKARLANRLVAYCRSRDLSMPTASEAERYPWLSEVGDDAAFVARLCEESEPWSLLPSGETSFDRSSEGTQSFGLSGNGGNGRRILMDGAGRLKRSAIHHVSTPLVSLVRNTVAPGISLFTGDVLTYLAKRGTSEDPGPIVRIVAEAIEDAQAERDDGDPLVVVAHSMGGNIVYDVLTHYRPDLHVDLLITVGSQVGLFEELGLFNVSDPAIPNPATPRAAAPDVGRWINVFDRADPLSYRAGPVFEAVADYAYPTGSWWAHGSYFVQPHFHDRLARRVAKDQSMDQSVVAKDQP